MKTESNGSIRVEVKCKECGEEFVLYAGRFDQYAGEAQMVDSGNKYRKQIGSAGTIIMVDVYDVIKAYRVACPARQHAIKKLLAAGQRGGKTEKQDLEEAIVSINRSIELIDPKEGK